MKKLFFTFLFVLVALNAHAVDYWVNATGGSDSNCTTIQTEGTPALTINFALDCAGNIGSSNQGAGDRVRVKSGTYSEAIDTNTPSGDVGNPFILQCETTGACIINGRVSGSEEVFRINTNNTAFRNIIVDGFVLDGSSATGSDGIWFSTSSPMETVIQNVTFQNMIIRNMGQFGALVGGTNFQLRHSRIHNICVTATNKSECHAIYLGDGADQVIIEHNQIQPGVGGYGVHMYSEIGFPTNNTVRDNYFEISQNSVAILLWGPGHSVYNNIIDGSKQTCLSGFCGGIETGSPASNANIINNTIYKASWHGLNEQTTNNDIVCANNIIVESGSNNINGSCDTETTNRTTGVGTDYMIDPANGNFSLKPSSAAINAGTSIAADGTWPGSSGRFVGASPDQGAIEAPIRLSATADNTNEWQIVFSMPSQSTRSGTGLQGCTVDADNDPFTMREDAGAVTESSCAHVGTNTIKITVGTLTGGTTLDDSYDYTIAASPLTDNLCIGDPNTQCYNATILSWTQQSATNNVSGAPSVTWTSIHFRCLSYYSDTSPAATDWLRAEDASNSTADTRCPIRAGGVAAVAMGVQVTAANPDTTSFDWYANRNGGAYSAMTNTQSATALSFANASPPNMSNAESIASAILTSPTNYVAGSVIAQQSSAPILDLAQNDDFQVILIVSIGSGAAVGDNFCIRGALSGQTETSITATQFPCFEVIQPAAGY